MADEVKQTYFGWFGSDEDIEEQFEVKLPEGTHVLFAYYNEESGYDGEAFVLFERDGQLFEVNGSHCSCYGLEGQWSEEEVVIEELVQRVNSAHDDDAWWHDHTFLSEEADARLLEILAERAG